MLRSIVDTCVLPNEITEFERGYLARLNNIAIRLFALHLPIFVLLAWINDTDPLLALVLTAATLVVPLAAPYVFRTPRAVAVSHGFTSMILGGLLVHFGQGPVQIEMHFYFFAMLAILSVFANPMTIVVAAVTVALHHVILWAILPRSIFNYDAPFWVVLVHAAFVVGESVVACFIARGFFDNVIGLEKIVAARTAELDARNRDMRLVLDNAHQGFLTVDRRGRMGQETSAAVERWLGAHIAGTPIWDFLERIDANVANLIRIGFDDLDSDFMPAELVIHQLPSTLFVDGRALEIEYSPIYADALDDELVGMLVVIDDVTERNERARLEAEQKEIFTVFDRILRDRAGFIEFFEEADRLVAEIVGNRARERTIALRQLHTLKGNSAIFGIQTLSELCHEVESRMIETGELASEEDRERINTRWIRLGEHLATLIGERAKRRIEIEDVEYEAVLAAVRSGAPAGDIASMIQAWRLEPTVTRLSRMADQARRLAARAGLGDLQVELDDGGLRIDPARWGDFWSAMIHVLRNAVDHGFESESERLDAGKPARPQLALETKLEDDELIVAVEDDGRGIDWAALRRAAQAKGLDVSDLESLLFADGVSSRESVSELSGRGVGMAAISQAAERLGGSVNVQTHPGRGTRFEFRFPVKVGTDVVRGARPMALRYSAPPPPASPLVH